MRGGAGTCRTPWCLLRATASRMRTDGSGRPDWPRHGCGGGLERDGKLGVNGVGGRHLLSSLAFCRSCFKESGTIAILRIQCTNHVSQCTNHALRHLFVDIQGHHPHAFRRNQPNLSRTVGCQFLRRVVEGSKGLHQEAKFTKFRSTAAFFKKNLLHLVIVNPLLESNFFDLPQALP